MPDDRHDEDAEGRDSPRSDPRNRPRGRSEDGSPSRRRPREDDDERDSPRRRRYRDDSDQYRPEPTEVSILGILSLIQGIGSLIVSFIPCVGWLGIGGGVIGLILGVIGIVVANKSGRQGKGLPISGTVVSGMAILIGTAWLLVVAAFFRVADKAVEEIQEHQAKIQERQAKQTQVILAGPAIAVSATALDKEYDDNVVSADGKYKGKVLEVTGKVVRVAKEQFGRLTVELDAAEGNSSVDCEFSESSRDQLVGLAPGQTITIRGMCQGKVADSVTLEKCTVAKKTETTPSSVVAVTVDDLNKDYSKDPVSADTKYKGKVIEVSGKVIKVTKLPRGGSTVELAGAAGSASVDCSFEESAAGKLGKLAAGQKATIRGTCTGKVGTTTLEKCTFVK